MEAPADDSTEKLAQRLSPTALKAVLAGFLLLPVFLLLAAEGFLALKFRRDYPGTTLAVQGRARLVRDSYRDYANNPGYVRRKDGVTYRYNNFGFREEEDLKPKQPDEFRVFFMGGSAAYGGRASEVGQYQAITGQLTYRSDQTISAHLERALQAALPERSVNVINATVVNYAVHHSFMHYLTTIRSLEPDLIVTMDGWNEDYLPFAFKSPLPDNAGGPLAIWLRQHSHLLFYAGIAFSESPLFHRLSGRFVETISYEELARQDAQAIREQLIRQADESEAPPSIDPILKVYAQFWFATRLDGVPALFTVQPVTTLDRTKKLTPKEETLLKYLTHLRSHKTAVLHLARRLEERAAGDPQFHAMGLLDVFADYEGEAYTDYCHLTPEANRHLAGRLRDRILATPALLARAGASAPKHLSNR